MPFYDWQCPDCALTREVFSRVADRNAETRCTCGHLMHRTIAAPHVPVDGVYSYAPNAGSLAHFERNEPVLRTGQKEGRR